jgi:predicted nucleic acid-binding protein
MEMPPVWGPRADRYVTNLLTSKVPIAISQLTRLECRVQPLVLNNLALLAQYESFFHAGGVQLHDLTIPVCEKAAELRAKHRFKLGDALVVASAIVHSCDRLVTNDRRLSACTDITIEILP